MAAEWGTEDGKDHVELPNDEYAQWWVDQPERIYRVVRWSGALGLAEMADQAPEFIGDLSSANNIFVHYPSSGAKEVNLEEFQTQVARGGSEFFRLDSPMRDRALLWSAPDPNPPHDGPEYAECSVIIPVEDDRTDLQNLIVATATPEVRVFAEEIVERVFSRTVHGKAEPSTETA